MIFAFEAERGAGVVAPVYVMPPASAPVPPPPPPVHADKRADNPARMRSVGRGGLDNLIINFFIYLLIQWSGMSNAYHAIYRGYAVKASSDRQKIALI